MLARRSDVVPRRCEAKPTSLMPAFGFPVTRFKELLVQGGQEVNHVETLKRIQVEVGGGGRKLGL